MFNLSIPTLDSKDSFGAYAAGPEDAPTIIVIQEIFGTNAGIRAKCDALAAQGWRAIAIDLFWRQVRGLELDPDVPEQFQQAIDYMNQYNLDDGVTDIEATIRFARGQGAPKVGVVGYCMGGGLAFLAATRTDTDASVGYYGGPIPSKLNEAHAIAKPVLLHFGENDHFIDADKRRAIHEALDANPHVTIHDYPGVDHGFATQFGKRRDEAAATLADSRTAAFFSEHLK
ncbi:dienelactone hydrolase family protein [Sphingomonas quercus]|uniref:Dienelactone hydrolase family protein n=1 Tax=Sphingomonas quercus TaxID=2842451 RepID=A0ABS6BGI2_9SPHN|nr:dienelactone hydrolase family protein [Sphingomonas quercus]MBU3076931.1 dienelactone hydrolase family protein [Sphingomonas quercus]